MKGQNEAQIGPGFSMVKECSGIVVLLLMRRKSLIPVNPIPYYLSQPRLNLQITPFLTKLFLFHRKLYLITFRHGLERCKKKFDWRKYWTGKGVYILIETWNNVLNLFSHKMIDVQELLSISTEHYTYNFFRKNNSRTLCPFSPSSFLALII